MSRRLSRRAVVLTAATAAVLVLGASTWWVVTLNARAHEAEQHLLAARAALGSGAASSVLNGGDTTSTVGQLTGACSEAAQADAVLQDVSGQIQPVMPLVAALESVPGVGDRARTDTATLQSGSDLAAAGAAVCQGMQPLADVLASSASSASDANSSTAASLQALVQAGPTLARAADRLDATLASLENVSDAELDNSARDNLAGLRARLPGMIQGLRDASALLQVLGASGERRFLLVSQNPDELRATGGYIGSAGVLSVTNGNVRLVEYGSSRSYDTPADRRAVTPIPFDTFLGSYWDLAGANWWSSFPDVARQLEYFYSVARPDQPALDGVIAVDQSALADLVDVLGPVDVPEYSEQVTAANLQSKLDQYVHAGDGADETGRKQFTSALSAAVLQQALAAPKAQLPNLVKAVRNALTHQDLLIAVSDHTAASVLARHRWDGGLLPASRDSLMVVDSELSASKQSQSVKRDVTYNLDLSDPNAPRARVEITYTNQSQPEPNVQYVPNYRTFVRVYAPAGASLSASSGLDDAPVSMQECGRTVFGGDLTVSQGDTANVVFTYALPASVVAGGVYDLVVQSQPGLPPGQLEVDVHETNGTVAHTVRDNARGQSFHWQVNADGTGLQAQPLPVADGSDCGIPIVNTTPLATPDWIDIPKAKISAQIVEIGVDSDGAMQPPPTPDVVGWYTSSARAGQPGNTVLAGHVDWGKNTAVFWGLRYLLPSDAITLRGGDGIEHHYTVQSNRTYANDDPSAIDALRGSQESLLTLITCDGTYDRSAQNYSERRIVQAVLSE